MQLHVYGLNYSIERPISSYITNLTAETDRVIRLLDVPHYGNKQVKADHQLKRPK